MKGSFWNNVVVELFAELDRINVVTFQITVHDCEINLGEQVQGIEYDSEDKKPKR